MDIPPSDYTIEVQHDVVRFPWLKRIKFLKIYRWLLAQYGTRTANQRVDALIREY